MPIAIVQNADQLSMEAPEVDPQEITGNHILHLNLDLILALIILEDIPRFLDLYLEMDP